MHWTAPGPVLESSSWRGFEKFEPRGDRGTPCGNVLGAPSTRSTEGYGRAGYYGHDVLENLGSPRGLRSAEWILPQFRDFEVGDEVPISALFALIGIGALREVFWKW
jgi:hypothetical protein